MLFISNVELKKTDLVEYSLNVNFIKREKFYYEDTSKLGYPCTENKNSCFIYNNNTWSKTNNIIKNLLKNSDFNNASNGDKVYKLNAYKAVNKDEYIQLLNKVEEIYKINYNNFYNFEKDVVFIEKFDVQHNAKICIIGDLHSSLHSLWTILTNIKDDFFSNSEKFILKDNHYIIFLGDIVDRGPYGIELFWIIFTLFINNPNKVRIINGNHEDIETYVRYGFYHENINQFNIVYKMENKTKNIFEKIYWYLPSAIFLKFGDDSRRFQLCHGGPAIKENLESIKFFLNTDIKYYVLDDTDDQYMHSLKWGEFHIKKQTGYNDTGFLKRESGRDEFSQKYVKWYNEELNLISIISGHQDTVNFAYQDDEILNDYNCGETIKYNLHCVKENREFILPNEFYSCVTSTALSSRYNDFLNKHCYLTLQRYEDNNENNQIIKDIIKKQNEKFIISDSKGVNNETTYYENAMFELETGKKQSNWISYIFPSHRHGSKSQLKLANFNGYKEFLENKRLYTRLINSVNILTNKINGGNKINNLMGSNIDTIKLKESIEDFL